MEGNMGKLRQVRQRVFLLGAWITFGVVIPTESPFGNPLAAHYTDSKIANQSTPEAPGVFYYHEDHLRSSSLITDSHGSVSYRASYRAFGRGEFSKKKEIFSPTRLYTGQEFDEESDLYFFRSRYYDPNLGRFIQPDTIIPNIKNPQTMNAYSYVLNNPLRYIDPSGHAPEPSSSSGPGFWDAFKNIYFSNFNPLHFFARGIGGILHQLGLPRLMGNILGGTKLGNFFGLDPTAGPSGNGSSQEQDQAADGFFNYPAVDPPSNFWGYLKAAGKELFSFAWNGAISGGLIALLGGGGGFLAGALMGAKFLGALSAAQIFLFGPEIELPYSGMELSDEFDKQSATDESGLGLALPAKGSYTVRAGGLLASIPGFRMRTLGRTIFLKPSEIKDIALVTHELRHVAQFNKLGAIPFVWEYASIVDNQILESITGDGGLKHNSEFGHRLEPKF